MSDSELNKQLSLQLNNYVQTDSDIVQGILSFDCIVGQKGCVYSDRTSLSKGKMAPVARNRLINTLSQKKTKKPLIHGKTAQPKLHLQNNLAQTLKHVGKQVGVKAPTKMISKPFNKKNFIQGLKKKQSVQMIAQIKAKTLLKRDAHLE